MKQNSEKKVMDRWRNIIHNSPDGIIRFDELIDKSHCSVGMYNKLKSFFEHKFEHEVIYSKEDKLWRSLSIPEVEKENEVIAKKE